MKESQKTKSKSKYLVISGYVMLVAIIVTGLWLIFKNLVEFSSRMIDEEDKKELILVGNVINGLYEIEGTNNLMVFESATEYLESFDSIRPIVSSRLDSLKHLTVDTNRIIMLDSIEVLLDEKHQNLVMIHELMDSVRKAPQILRESVSSIVPSRLNREISDYLGINEQGSEEVDQQMTDTTVIKQERKSLFRRLGDAFAGRQDSTVILQNRPTVVVQKDFKLMVDTVVQMVRYSERLNLERQRKFQTALLQRQSAMNQNHLILTNKIDNLLKTIEKEEIDNTRALIGARDSVLSDSYRMVFVFSIVASIIALLFGLFFIIDFNKIQRYKRRLEQSNARINELLQSREKLMLAVSHDIKAPMSSILGYLELMQSDKIDDKQQNYVSNMKKSGNHILQLVTNLLDFNKIESDSWKQHAINFNLSELIDNTTSSFHPAAQEKQLQFLVNNHISSTQQVHGDPFMLRQIISNLISNAIKFTHKGFVKIEAKFDSQTHRLSLKVEDSGIGINAEDFNAIFSEFTQLHSKNKNEFFEGSGLGLAITKGLIDRLNGNIKLESVKNKGSVFSIDIPLQTYQKESSEKNADIEKHFNFSDCSILVIDDDKIHLTMMSEMLKKQNAEVFACSDVQDVPDVLKQRNFDIIFIDLQMPQKNGFALADELIKNRLIDPSKTAFIAVSAKSNIKRNEYENAGFRAFLNKPFSSGKLYEIIAKQLNMQTEVSSDEKKSTDKLKGIEALVEVVKEDKAAVKEILEAFVQEAQPLKNALTNTTENLSSNAQYYAHKMLPLFMMMGDDQIAQVLKKIDKRVEVTDSEISLANNIIDDRIEEAQRFIEQFN